MQKLFATNSGDTYHSKVISKNDRDSLLAASCVSNSKTGEVIVKLVNAGGDNKSLRVNLQSFKHITYDAEKTELRTGRDTSNATDAPPVIVPATSTFKGGGKFTYTVPPFSLTVLRFKQKD